MLMIYRERVSERTLVVTAFKSNVIATDIASGERVWTYEAAPTALLRIEIASGKVFLLGTELACLEHETGRALWRTAVPSACRWGTLLVVGEAVVVGGAGEIACFDAATGAARWHDKFAGLGRGDVALAIPGHAAQADTRGE
jgi:outer membrane protein assembly factor BamB